MLEGLRLDIGAGVAALWAVVFLLVYGYELFNFSLSIDEEFHTFAGSWVPLAWLQQGRWGMAALTLLLPPISGLPVVSTALFGGGMLLALAHLATDYRLRGLSAVLFGIVVLASPIWPHVVEFNSLSYGIGIGLALCAIGVRLLAQPGALAVALGLGAIAFAAAIYQTLIFAAVVMALGRHLVRTDAGSVLRSAVRELSLIVLAALLSLGIQQAAMRAVGAEVAHVDQLWRVSEYLANPSEALGIALAATRKLLLGSHPLFFGYGTLFAWAPFGALAWTLARERRSRSAWRALWLTGLALGAMFVPVFVSLGGLPARGMVALPFLLAAMTATFPLRSALERRVAGAFLVALVVLATTVSARLFYSDHLARERDRLIAASLLERLQPLRSGDRPLPTTVVGALATDYPEPVARIEVFGASFFEYDQGNVYRVVAFLRILGASHLDPIEIAYLPAVAEQAKALPAWPDPGSVALIDGVAVIKFSPLTSWQRERLCARWPGQAACPDATTAPAR